MSVLRKIFGLSCLAIAWNASGAAAPDAAERPNVVVLLADDLGYGDLGSYGHPVHRTPHIDQLAAEGQRWTDFYAAAPVCTPSRGSLLTGRLPIRLGLEAPAGKPNVFFPFSTSGLPLAEVTLAELLKPAGYATALIGKWHLGFPVTYSPNAQGFDYFFGTPGSNDMSPAGPWSMELFFKEPGSRDWDVPLYRNDKVVERPVRQDTLTARYTEEAVAFIRQNRDRPFFLMLSWNMPHVPLFATDTFRKASGGGLYAAAVEELDWSAGQVVAALKELGLDRKTLVVFTSDNGAIPLFRERGGSNGLLRGGKGTTWEGGLRVPGIFWGPGRVEPGVVHGIGSQLDLLPTVAELAGRQPAADRALDGVSLVATLSARAPSPRDSVVYYRQGEIYALRKGTLKAHFTTEGVYGEAEARNAHDPPLLFDLSQDAGERFPIPDSDTARLRQFEQLKAAQEIAAPAAPSELLKGLPPGPGG